MKNQHDHARILIEKAENDLKLIEIALDHDAPTDTIAFHLQQAAEKMLKALLASRTITYPKTHNLDELLDLLPADLSEILLFRESLFAWTVNDGLKRDSGALFLAPVTVISRASACE